MKRFLIVVNAMVLVFLAACSNTQTVSEELPDSATITEQYVNNSEKESINTKSVEADDEKTDLSTPGDILIESAGIPDKKYLSISLTKIADVPIEQFASSEYFKKTSDDKYALVNIDGQTVSGHNYDYIGQIYWDLLRVAKYDEDNYPNIYGMILRDGTEIIPCNAAIIRAANSRFYYVIYSTGKVDNESDAFFYVTDQFVAFRPDEDDELYDGYMLIYDLQKRAFIENFKCIDGSFMLEAAGNTMVYRPKSGEPKQVLDENGKVLASGEYYVIDNYIVGVNEDRTRTIYDGDMKELAHLDFHPSKIYGGKVFAYEDMKGGNYVYYVTDSNSEKITERAFSRTPVFFGNFVYNTKNESEGDPGCIYLLDGTKIVDGEIEIDMISNLDGGFLLVSNDSYSWIIYPNGDYIKRVNTELSTSVISSDNTEAFIVSRGESTPMGNRLISSGYEWLAIDMDYSSSSSKEALYSLVDGEQLLGYEYERITYKYGYIYAEKKDVCEVYSLNLDY